MRQAKLKSKPEISNKKGQALDNFRSHERSCYYDFSDIFKYIVPQRGHVRAMPDKQAKNSMELNRECLIKVI